LPLSLPELIGLTRTLIEPALQWDARRLRRAFGTPCYVQLARERAVPTKAAAP
jgi:hypothetical protein